MPRHYMQPQPGLFVGQSARQDVAQGRARADQERVRQQRVQGFQYTGQARQAGRTQREAQRAAQQQMAMASQERDADRQFQMQRDAFGARRDYSMQERRIQSAAEQAQFGRDFEREQQDTRFGQQQDLAMQEQDYRLQQLDIAAQDQFLSAEQKAEIQRERDMLVSDMQRDTAREGRLDQFWLGESAADSAADRSSFAAREKAGISDRMDARHQGRAAGYQEDAQGRAEKFATEQAYLQQGFKRKNAEYENEAKLVFSDLDAAEQARIRDENRDAARMFADENVVRDIYAASEKQKMQDDSARAREDRKADEAAQQLKDSEMYREIDLIENNDNFSPAEKDQRTAGIISQYDAMDNRRWRSPTPSDRMGNATTKDSRGNVLNVDEFGRVSIGVPAPARPIIIGGEQIGDGEIGVSDSGEQILNLDGKPVRMGTTAKRKRRDATSARRENERTILLRELYSSEKLLGGMGTQPKYTDEKRVKILSDFDAETEAMLEPEQEQGGGPREEGRAVPSADTQATDRWGHTPDEADQVFNHTLKQMAEDPPNLEWAQHQSNLMRGRYKIGEPGEVPWEEWSPQDRAFYWKALQDLKKLGQETGVPAKAVSTPPPARKPAFRETDSKPREETRLIQKTDRGTLEKLERSQQGYPQEGPF